MPSREWGGLIVVLAKVERGRLTNLGVMHVSGRRLPPRCAGVLAARAVGTARGLSRRRSSARTENRFCRSNIPRVLNNARRWMRELLIWTSIDETVCVGRKSGRCPGYRHVQHRARPVDTRAGEAVVTTLRVARTISKGVRTPRNFAGPLAMDQAVGHMSGPQGDVAERLKAAVC